MCGIAGQFNFTQREPVDSRTVVRMAQSIAHRGPDDEGFFIAGPVGLAFRRLSIIDLAGGHQPMSDVDKTVWVVFNGEIYNFKELRAELEQHGHRFRTNSDTEVIVHGYKQWGVDVLNHLNGMFGLAIWDANRERLIVARDAMGIKLIYYKIDRGRLSFGSEIRALLAANPVKPEVDVAALKLFLQFRYTPSPLTIFNGIRKLAAGTMLVLEKGNCREERWYNYVPTPFATPKKHEEATRELLELYRAAVGRHLLSDVPVGLLLSGGLDSGLLLALMNEHGGPWPAYSIGYGETFQDDELADAAETASIFGARHVTVRLERAEFARSLPKIVERLEEPIAASSIVPMYFISQRARQDVKVALIGQGPDELFGGYKRHLGVYYGEWWRLLPEAVRAAVSHAVNGLPRNETLKRGVASLGTKDRVRRYQDVFSLAPSPVIDALFQDRSAANGTRPELFDYWQGIIPQMANTNEIGGFQLVEIRSSLPDELLMYADKLSMAHSLEVRVPYLDRTIVEYVQRLGASFAIRNGTRKWLHRKVCEKYLPQRILKRRKRGFAVNVVDDWFRSSLESEISDLLLNERALVFDLLKPEPIRELLKNHRSGRQDNHKLLFSLVMVEQWLRTVTSSVGRNGPDYSATPLRYSKIEAC
jgi:asparagine synthase (glutamine-hydrolysing)